MIFFPSASALSGNPFGVLGFREEIRPPGARISYASSVVESLPTALRTVSIRMAAGRDSERGVLRSRTWVAPIDWR